MIKSRLLSHLAFWIWVYAFFSVMPIASGLDYTETLGLNLLYLPIDLALVYFCLYVLIPAYIPHKKYIHFLITWYLSLLVANGVSLIFDFTITKFIFEFTPENIIYRLFISQLILFMISGLAITLKILKYTYEIQLKQTNLELKLKVNEIRMLKAQINPHFIFNTLNNIDTLIFQNKEMASESLMQLSEIMRYTLHKAPQSMVSLDEELAMLNNYIKLSKIRYRDPEFISFSYVGDTTGLTISPMILIVYIENAIKHSDNQGLSPGIIIRIDIKGSRLLFESTNRIGMILEQNPEEKGVGLENAKKRLALLYAGKHQLETIDTKTEFIVKLQIDLA
jgi:two-component system LytT family sensor kinase